MMPWPGQPFEGGPPGREGGARPEKGENLPLWRRHLRRGDASERISDREVQDHIADIRGAFKVPLGAFRFPRGPDGNGNVDP